MSQIKCRGKTGDVKSISICDYGNGDVKLLLSMSISGIDCHLFNVDLSEIEVIGNSVSSYACTESIEAKNKTMFDLDNPYSLQALGRFRCENWE